MKKLIILTVGAIVFPTGCTWLKTGDPFQESNIHQNSSDSSDIAATRMERHFDGLFYVKGETEPYTGKVRAYYLGKYHSLANLMEFENGRLKMAKCWSPGYSGGPKGTLISKVIDGTGSIQVWHLPHGPLKSETFVEDSVFTSARHYDRNGNFLREETLR